MSKAEFGELTGVIADETIGVFSIGLTPGSADGPQWQPWMLTGTHIDSPIGEIREPVLDRVRRVQ